MKWILSDESINQPQANTIQRFIDRAKNAHYCNIYLRINGKDEVFQGDWLKHLAPMKRS